MGSIYFTDGAYYFFNMKIFHYLNTQESLYLLFSYDKMNLYRLKPITNFFGGSHHEKHPESPEGTDVE